MSELQVHKEREGGRESERRGVGWEIKELTFYFCVKVGKWFLEYNSADTQKHTNRCF